MRKAEQIIIVGTNGTGKTTLVGKLIQAVAKRGQRALIVTPDPVEWLQVEEIEPEPQLLRKGGFEGVRKIVYFDDKSTLDPIKNYYFDGVLVFDDCRSYFKAATSEALKHIFIRRRQKMTDIVIVAHGFTDVPPQYFTYTTRYYIFKTVDNISKRKGDITDFERVKRTVEAVRAKANSGHPHHYKMITI